MKRCAFILPWFGPLRNYFDIFLRSCSINGEYDWIILTDHVPEQTPDNVRIRPMTFEEFQRAAQSKFEFRIALDRPYKICDFKPALGYIFEEELGGYEYWGHCDCDFVFGRLAPILESLFDKGYEKIFSAGHLTIYRNDPLNNRRFMQVDKDGVDMHRIALSNPGIFAFDESLWTRSVHTLFMEQGAAMYEADRSFNVSTSYYGLRRTIYDPTSRGWVMEKEQPQALWLDASGACALYRIGDAREVRRYAYIHLQGREMGVPDCWGRDQCLQITPNQFIPMSCPCAGDELPEGLRTHFISAKAMRLMARRAKHALLKEPEPSTRDSYLPFL